MSKPKLCNHVSMVGQIDAMERARAEQMRWHTEVFALTRTKREQKAREPLNEAFSAGYAQGWRAAISYLLRNGAANIK